MFFFYPPHNKFLIEDLTFSKTEQIVKVLVISIGVSVIHLSDQFLKRFCEFVFILRIYRGMIKNYILYIQQFYFHASVFH